MTQTSKLRFCQKENQKKGGTPGSEKKPTTAETLKKATEAAVAEQKKKGSDGVIGKKRRRRLMSIDTGRLSMHELRELKDEFLAEKDTAKRQEIWKKKVLKLDDDLQKKFQDLLDGREVDDEKDDEPKLVQEHADHEHHDDGSRHARSRGDIDGRAPEDHPHYAGHTEGCLIYGAVAAEKVPGTLRITAKSKWHDFVAQHIDLSHTVHHLSFGDLTHVLQNEFEHIDFHEYEGLRYISTLGASIFNPMVVK